MYGGIGYFVLYYFILIVLVLFLGMVVVFGVVCFFYVLLFILMCEDFGWFYLVVGGMNIGNVFGYLLGVLFMLLLMCCYLVYWVLIVGVFGIVLLILVLGFVIDIGV